MGILLLLLRVVEKIRSNNKGKHLAQCLAHSSCSINSSYLLIIIMSLSFLLVEGATEDAWVGAKSSGRGGHLKGL